MMAKSQSQFLENLDAQQLLPDVLSVLLDPTKKVIDDTCVEKLLSWLTQLASMPVTLKSLLNERTDVVGFLQKSTLPECSPSAMVFALRLTAILLNSLTGFLSTGRIEVVEDPSLDERADDIHVCLFLKFVDIISDLAESLLISAYNMPYWQEASVRNAWFVSAKTLVGSRCSSEIIQRIGLVDVALQSLEDNCMFVVSATQQFLADLIATTHACSSGENGPRSPQHCGVKLRSDDDGLQVLTSHPQASEVSSAIVRATSPRRSTIKSQESSKRPRLDRNTEKSLDTKKSLDTNACERQNCDCKIHLDACLQKLTAILKPVKLLRPLIVCGRTGNSQTKLRSVTIGVLVRLVESWPVIGHRILADMSIVSVLSKLLDSSSQITSDTCSATVEFISVFLQTLDRETDMESSAATVVIGLPMKLMNIHQFSSAIQLASNLFSSQQRLKGNIFHSKLQCRDACTCSSLLRIVMLPVDCTLNLSDCQTRKLACALNAIKECLVQSMTSHKRQCVSLLCHSLSAMEKMVAEGLYHIMSQQTCLVDHVTSILSLTLGQASQHVIGDSLRCHLRESIKVTKAVLHLATAAVVSANQCSIKLTETSARNLLLQLTAVLNNPESDCTVVSKCFDVLVPFLSVYAVILKHDTDVMAVLGETVTKRSYDLRWEVRDSVMCFLQRLLECSADVVCVWFVCHNLHVRITECTDDGESFVRASALNALVNVSRQQALWDDMLQQIGKTEVTFVGQFIDVMLADSQGFARRATVCMYTKWLMVFSWLQAGLPGSATCSCQGQQSEVEDAAEDFALSRTTTMGDTEHLANEELSVASQIRSGVSAAMLDLDWEVKLGALEFWKTLIEMYVPTRTNGTFSDENRRPQCDREKLDQSKRNNLSCGDHTLMLLLRDEGLVGRLVNVLDDEDRTVAVKACQMLLGINNLLQSEEDVRQDPKMEDPGMEEFSKTTRETLDALRLEVLLDEKLMVVDGYEHHPLSLLQDILAGTQEKDDNILDCY